MRHDKEPKKPAPANAAEAELLKQLETFHQFVDECNTCQKEVETHWQFCAHCGVRLATQCPGCGTPLPPAGALTCPHCGLAMPQTEP
jgi:predicted amidophosphoribosyltransferase